MAVAQFGNATETRGEHQQPRADNIRKSENEKDIFVRSHDQYLRPVMMLLTLQR